MDHPRHNRDAMFGATLFGLIFGVAVGAGAGAVRGNLPLWIAGCAVAGMALATFIYVVARRMRG